MGLTFNTLNKFSKDSAKVALLKVSVDLAEDTSLPELPNK
jgi:hypothetical protein